MTDDPLYHRLKTRIELGRIETFQPIAMLDVPLGMLHKLGANTSIDPKDLIVEQTSEKDIIVYYIKPETDDEYEERMKQVGEAVAIQRIVDQAAQEVAVSWQKFLQLADRFRNRILVLTITPEFE